MNVDLATYIAQALLLAHSNACHVSASPTAAATALLCKYPYSDNVHDDSKSPSSSRAHCRIAHLPQISHALRQLDLLGPPFASRVTHVLRRLNLGYVLQDDIADPHNTDDRARNNSYGWLVQQNGSDKDVNWRERSDHTATA